MADNITVKDSTGSDKVMRTTDFGTYHIPHHTIADPVDGRVIARGADITTVAGTAANTDLFSTPAGSYSYFSVQLYGTFSATVTFQASNDNVTWVSTAALAVGSSTTYVTTSTGTGIFYLPVTAKYVRARVTSYTSGTVTANVFATTSVAPVTPYAPSTVTASLSTSTSITSDVGIGARATSTNANLRYYLNAGSGNNAVTVKASAGRVFGYQFANTTTSFRYVKIFAKATAPVVGTDTPITTIAIPPNSYVSMVNPIGIYQATGISIATTAGAADLDTSTVAANEIVGELIYA